MVAFGAQLAPKSGTSWTRRFFADNLGTQTLWTPIIERLKKSGFFGSKTSGAVETRRAWGSVGTRCCRGLSIPSTKKFGMFTYVAEMIKASKQVGGNHRWYNR